MQTRNPFTNLSNLSFVRNAANLPSNRAKSYSSSCQKRYFDYQGSYLRDSYLLDMQVRHNQDVLSSRVMGVESLRYSPPPAVDPYCPKLQSKGEYYNLQTFSNQPASQSIRSQQQTTMKNSTKDMFGSDYFKNRFGNQQDQKLDSYQALVNRKPSLHKNISNGNSRFKKQQEITFKEYYKEEESSQKIEQTDNKLQNENGDPKTLFLKSRKKLFYLYQFSDEDDN